MMVLEPSFVQAAPGDKVHFVPTEVPHNAEPIRGMLPAGVTAPAGGMHKAYVITVTKRGLYGIKCMPHHSLGMVALIKVGKGAAPNAAAAAIPLPPLAKRHGSHAGGGEVSADWARRA